MIASTFQVNWNHLGQTFSDAASFFTESLFVTKTSLFTWFNSPFVLSQSSLSSVINSVSTQACSLLNSPEVSCKKVFKDNVDCALGARFVHSCEELLFQYVGLVTCLHTPTLARFQAALKTAFYLKKWLFYGKTQYEEALYYQDHPKEFEMLSSKHQLTLLQHLRVLTSSSPINLRLTRPKRASPKNHG